MEQKRTFEEILNSDYHVILEETRRDESMKLAAEKYAAQFRSEQKPLADEQIEALAEDNIREDKSLAYARGFSASDLFSYGIEKFVIGYKAALQ